MLSAPSKRAARTRSHFKCWTVTVSIHRFPQNNPSKNDPVRLKSNRGTT